MKRILAGPRLAAVSLLLAACPTAAERNEPEQGDTAQAAGPGSGDPVCLRGRPFVATGSVPLRPAQSADAKRVGGLRWEPYDGCERLVIDLLDADDSAAARAGVITAEVLRELGVVRISLRDVETVHPEATDRNFNGALARAAYSVWSPDGRWVFVDVHLSDAAEVHVSTLEEPARVVVDLRPGGPAIPDAAVRAERIVVLAPRPGPAAYPLTVTGYARTFEANVVVRLEQDGRQVFEDFTTATAWADAWGHYSLTIASGPAGRLELHVGEHSARDGSWQGAALDLEMR